MSRILVTGSRGWTDHDTIYTALALAHLALDSDPETVLVHGAARGADLLAARIWQEHGLPTEAHPADWDAFGRSAGFIRNARMVRLGADVCLAFHLDNSPGTASCIQLARDAGIPVRVFD